MTDFIVAPSSAPEWTKKITLSPAHQNLAKAPPNPTENLELSKDSAKSLAQAHASSTAAPMALCPCLKLKEKNDTH
ncbi:class v [Fusarium austroafricanum]|uniref:Class v n=1 Tax=Fusarium austroafricanum TaxID=2364996 RepID=A0A8H4JMY4_9HYPO|nr:class v [Fusarium austroafricanum]